MKVKIFCMLIFITFTLIGIVYLYSFETTKDNSFDWPRFRGPNGTGISNETGLLKSWPAEGPQEVWRVPIGVGYSGIAVVNDRLYTMDSQAESEFLVCFDSDNGREIWRTKVGPLYKNSYGDGPRTTPTIESDIVYAIGANGNLIAANANDGQIHWSVDLKSRFEVKAPDYWWGFCMSPFIDDNRILLQVGGAGNKSIVALNKKNGETLWTTHTDVQAYSTPLAIDFNNQRQYVFVTAQHVVSLSPSGQINWKYPWGGSIIKVAMPVFVPPDKIYVSAAYGIGAVLLRLKEAGDGAVGMVEEVWKSMVMSNHFHTSVLLDGYLYGFDNGTFKCVEAETGEQTWARRRLGKGSLIYADGHLIVLGERGQLVLVEANPNEYVEKGQVRILKGRTWTPPTLANGKLFLRHQNEMVCLNLRAQKS